MLLILKYYSWENSIFMAPKVIWTLLFTDKYMYLLDTQLPEY